MRLQESTVFRVQSFGAVALITAGAAVSSGCDDDRGARRPRPDEIPVLASIPAGKATLGLELGTQREEQSLEAFRITKYPITVKHYRQCVAAGACDAPALASFGCGAASELTHLRGPTFNVPDGEELPITCVTPEQAVGYCRWLGGTLPDSSQWLVAARGTSVQRYAWGSKLDACEQHPEARLRAKKCDVSDPARFRVGRHRDGASPMGLEDVLSTPAELLATSPTSLSSACAPGVSACLVRGLSPGAIDGFVPVASGDQKATPSFGFRCALEAK